MRHLAVGVRGPQLIRCLRSGAELLYDQYDRLERKGLLNININEHQTMLQYIGNWAVNELFEFDV